ncbi:sulfite exporter TauE/SafE family protein [Rhabdaerophilum calidifontis]|uniref:sulfite exporter TauE/SafE family protein n=1 Tax=Rhabdaerophilum calidifontis TaxID=2604328 RepID=UPI00123C0E3C|nr:sulfite exporter TauE/SafE family protein [Rhabdaerophilum calidifontis]
MPYSDLMLAAATRFAADPLFWAIGLATIGLIAFSKGAFGGGAASLGVPMLSFVTDPVGAAILVAPLISVMDMFTLRSFGPSSWSRPDLGVLVPGLLLGLALGWLLVSEIDGRIVALVIGLVSLGFAGHWFWQLWRRASPTLRPIEPALGFVAGAASGFTTFIAHAGGPPVAMYLIRRGLDKRLFVGTTTAFFTLGNLLKLGPYGMLMAARPDMAAAALMLAPVIPLAVRAGIALHHRLSQRAILLLTNSLLVIGGARLVYVAAKALLP